MWVGKGAEAPLGFASIVVFNLKSDLPRFVSIITGDVDSVSNDFVPNVVSVLEQVICPLFDFIAA
jgi:hypothetical protein